MDTEQRNPVEMMAEEFAERLRAGEAPQVQEYVDRCPDQADVIRAVLQPIAAMERVVDKEHAERTFETNRVRLAEPNQTLGDFRIVRQIGHGGMGIVYEAIQESLNRRVAVKVLGPGVAGSRNQLRRFQLEAEAAAKLHHTNIVPVYGISNSDGLHFYAMQYIEGVPLDLAIRSVARGRSETTDDTNDDTFVYVSNGDGSTAMSQCDATLPLEQTTGVCGADFSLSPSVVQSPDGDGGAFPFPEANKNVSSSLSSNTENSMFVADRLCYANYLQTVATIGRDVALALKYAHESGVIHRDIKPANLLLDHEGTVWIADFGLAKSLDSDVHTRTGDIVGTLRYMAPEQFNGDSDQRSDICSLGLTLFEMLALKPAYVDSMHGPLLKAKTSQPVPRLRGIDRRIPRDVETIIAKACASDPAHRYQTAGAMAADLQRYLDDRPIRARRATPPELLYRWSRRNPAMATLSAVVMCSLMLVALVLGFSKRRLEKAFDRVTINVEQKTAALEKVKIESDRASNNLEVAMQAFREIVQNISDRGGLAAMSVEMSDGSITYGQGVVTPADAELLNTLLKFFNRFAEDNSTDLSSEVAETEKIVGDISLRLGRLDEADAAYKKSLSRYASMFEASPENDSLLLPQFRLLNALAVTARGSGEMTAAANYCLEAERLIQAAPEILEQPEGKYEYARALNIFTTGHLAVAAANETIRKEFMPPTRQKNAGGPRRGNGDWLKTMDVLRTRALAAQRGRNNSSTSPANRSPVLGFRDNGNLEMRRRRMTDLNGKAIELLSELSEQAPGNVSFALELAIAHRERARLSRHAADIDNAAESISKTKEILDALLIAYPDSPRIKYIYAETIGIIVSRVPRALPELNRALRLCDELREAYPQMPDYAALTAQILNYRGDQRALAEATDLMRDVLERYPDVARYRFLLAAILQRQAAYKARSNDWDDARALLTQAIKVLTANTTGSDVNSQFARRFTGGLREQLAKLEKEQES